MKISADFLKVLRQLFSAVVLFCLAVLSFGCSQKSYIGGINFDFPVCAVVYEEGTHNGEPYSGIVYREITDTEKLIAENDIPVLLIFLDDSQYSSNAISFLETLADDFSNELLVVRIYVEIAGNPKDVGELVQLFAVDEFPYFAMIKGGSRLGSVTGYSAGSEARMLDLIRSTIDSVLHD